MSARQPSAPGKRAGPTDGGPSRDNRRKKPTGSVAYAAAARRSVRIRGRLRDYLQFEITEMEKARSIMDCLATAMHAAAGEPLGPYYPDVALAASQMMSRTIGNLCELLLGDTLPNVSEGGALRYGLRVRQRIGGGI
jgi:hypothetical protein